MAYSKRLKNLSIISGNISSIVEFQASYNFGCKPTLPANHFSRVDLAFAIFSFIRSVVTELHFDDDT